MIQKVVRKGKLSEFDEIKENLAYWLSRTPEERVEVIEILRRQYRIFQVAFGANS